METTSARALEILQRENAIPYTIKPYMNHLIIEVDDVDENFESLVTKIEGDIRSCLEQKFQDQDDNLLFDVRHKDCLKSFKVYK